MSSPTPRLPGMSDASVRVFDLSLGQMLWSRRTIFLALMAGGPIVLGVIFQALVGLGIPAIHLQGGEAPGPTIFGLMIWVLYLRFIVPVLGVFYGTALIADEVDDRTITYLFVRPIPRGAVLLGKYLAYLVCTNLILLPSVLLVYFLVVPLGGGAIASTFLALVADLAILAVGLAVYGAVFALVGARVRRPLLTGLLFAFGWEQLAMIFPGSLKNFTVAYYLQALVPHAMPQDSTLSLLQSLFQDVPSGPISLLVLFLIGGGFLALAVRAVGEREYVLDQ